MKGKPKVLNTHGSLLGYKKYLPRNQHAPYKLYDALTFKASAKKANAVVVSSKLEYEDAVEFGISKKKLHVIPMGVDVDEYVDSPVHRNNDMINILFVGRIARVRRIEILLQAVAKLSIPFHVTLVGGEEKTASLSRWGYLDELKKLCKTLNISDRITFAGPVAQDELSTWYRKADIFVYPSLYENFGQPILEAAAEGLPVVSTDVGVAKEIVNDGETGFIVPADPGIICERITQFNDHKTRRLFGEKIQTQVKKGYDWRTIIKSYIEIYKSFYHS